MVKRHTRFTASCCPHHKLYDTVAAVVDDCRHGEGVNALQLMQNLRAHALSLRTPFTGDEILHWMMLTGGRPDLLALSDGSWTGYLIEVSVKYCLVFKLTQPPKP